MREEISTKTAKRKEERVTERRHDCDGTKQSRGTSAQSRNLPGGKQKEANRFHTLATHTKPNRNKTAHSSLSLPPSWIKARLTLMRESRVRGGRSVTKGGKLPRKINPRGLRGLQVPQNTCAVKECLVFTTGKKNKKKKNVLLQLSRAGAVASSSKFSRSFVSFSHALTGVVRCRHTTGAPSAISSRSRHSGWASCRNDHHDRGSGTLKSDAGAVGVVGLCAGLVVVVSETEVSRTVSSTVPRASRRSSTAC